MKWNPHREHLFFFCKVVDMFWKEVLSWISLYNYEVKDISFLDVFFGKFDMNKDFIVINHILQLAKFFIYRCKEHRTYSSFDVFKAKLRVNDKLKLYIASKNDVLSKHYAKWDSFNYFCFFLIPLSNTLQISTILASIYSYIQFCIVNFSIAAFLFSLVFCMFCFVFFFL